MYTGEQKKEISYILAKQKEKEREDKNTRKDFRTCSAANATREEKKKRTLVEKKRKKKSFTAGRQQHKKKKNQDEDPLSP